MLPMMVLRSSPGIALCALIAAAAMAGCGAGGSGSREKHQRVEKLPPHRLLPAARLKGPNDPHSLDLGLLVPHGERIRQVWFLRGGSQPDQILVEWIHGKPISPVRSYPDSTRWGLRLWTQTPV